MLANDTTGIMSFDRFGQLDPTHQVFLHDPAMVEKAIKEILDPIYGNSYDAELLSRAIHDLVQAYRGDYPGLLRCDTLYHDLRHALETGLTTARLLDGNAKSLKPGEEHNHFDADHALLAVLLALYHDIGLQRRVDEENLWGPVLIPIHEERGVTFMEKYLATTSLSRLANKSFTIMATKLIFNMPDTWSAFDRRLASIVASADLMSQMSDRYYLEKCRDFLFVEFSAIGLAGKLDSVYPDRETLLAKTPDFFKWVINQRLEEEYSGVYRLIEAHTGGGNPWMESIEQNMAFLNEILCTGEFDRLHRTPVTFIQADFPQDIAS